MNSIEKRLNRIEELSQSIISEIKELERESKKNSDALSKCDLQLNDLMEFMTFFSPNASESSRIHSKLKELRQERRDIKNGREVHLKVNGVLKKLKSSVLGYTNGMARANKTKAKKYEFRTRTVLDFYATFDNLNAREGFKVCAPKQKNLSSIEKNGFSTKRTLVLPDMAKQKEPKPKTQVKQTVEESSKEQDYLMERSINQHENAFWRLISLKDGKTIIEHRKMTKVMDAMIEKNISSVSCNHETANIINMSFGSIKKLTNLATEKQKDLLILNANMAYETILQ